MSVLHPCLGDHGEAVWIKKPHTASPQASWSDPRTAAVFLPGSDVPAVLGGIPLSPWADAPTSTSGWEKLAAAMPLSEPAFRCPAGLAAAAGVLILEPDGRAWCVAPSNLFGGHEFTFPEGRPASKGSLAAAALSEAFEETGLRVRLIGFLCDAMRSVTYTRFFVAERLGGSPAAMLLLGSPIDHDGLRRDAGVAAEACAKRGRRLRHLDVHERQLFRGQAGAAIGPRDAVTEQAEVAHALPSGSGILSVRSTCSSIGMHS
ncbi:MAG: hydrolase [Variovorax sp.]|nr:hydrolase [Variovorax sp.]